MSICTAIMARYTRKWKEGKLTTQGLFSSNGKLLSCVSVQIIHQVLFVTSNPGNSFPWSLHMGLKAGPPGRDTAVGFVFGHVFCCSGYIFVSPEHKEAFWFRAGYWAASKSSWLASTFWCFPLQGRTFCPTVELWERLSNWEREHAEQQLVRDFTLEPSHMVSSGEGGLSGVWFDTYSRHCREKRPFYL